MLAVVSDVQLFNVINDINKLNNKPITHISEKNISKIFNLLLNNNYTDIIIDIDIINNDIDTIINNIINLNQSSTSNIIIVAKDYDIESPILSTLDKDNIHIINNSQMIFIKKELNILLNSELNNSSNEIVKTKIETSASCPEEKESPPSYPPTQKENLFNINSNNHKITTIAFCGVLNRIGTTTQAFQIIKFLKNNNKTACYVQMNFNKHIEKIPYIYEQAIQDDNLCCIKYSNIDMYFNSNKISQILSMNYDFVIYDFGTFETMNKTQFLEKDIKIVVAGTKPYELTNLSDIFENFENDKINYIFSFSHINERMIIKEQMGEKQEYTYFSENSPGLFDYQSQNKDIYLSIISEHMNLYSNAPEEQKKKKPFLFRR